MSFPNHHITLSENSMATVRKMVGSFLEIAALENAVMDSKFADIETTGSLRLWFDGFPQPVVFGFYLSQEFPDTAVVRLDIFPEVESTATVQLKSMPFQLRFSDFLTRKVEIWAEKTEMKEGEEFLYCENTLYLINANGGGLLLYPDLQGPTLSLITDPDQIKRYLESGNLVLKHILD